jgi:DNA-binding NtrC family response regulator
VTNETTLPTKILIVDDEAIFRRENASYLAAQGYEVHEAETGEEAVERLQREEWDIVLLDIALPKMSGMDVLRQSATLSPTTFFLVVTAFASLDTAIEALRLGAYDYLKKPLRFEELSIRLQKLSQHRQLILENQALRRSLNQGQQDSALLGQSIPMQRVKQAIEQLKDTSTNVLISGESGVGKELVARAIHMNRRNAHRPFLPINVSAIPDTLLEAQLFGHQKGAFTGAEATQAGVLEAAAGGTVFLDEIGELPLHLQPRLLRAIEQKEVFPIGATSPKQLDFHLIAATNRNLSDMAQQGTFRDDLYYRLNVFHIEVPPLRQRKDDIPLFIQHFLGIFANALKKPLLGVTQEAMKRLTAASWPGNVRELKNVIERAAILANEPWIGIEQLPPFLQTQPTTSWRLQDAIQRKEKEHILTVLQIANGNKETAAEMLGIGLSTLYRRLEKLNAEQEDTTTQK